MSNQIAERLTRYCEKLYPMKITLNDISDLTGLSLKEVQEIYDQILFNMKQKRNEEQPQKIKRKTSLNLDYSYIATRSSDDEITMNEVLDTLKRFKCKDIHYKEFTQLIGLPLTKENYHKIYSKLYYLYLKNNKVIKSKKYYGCFLYTE